MRRSRTASRTVLLGALLLGSCRSPDPQAVLSVSDVEAYWAVDSAAGTTQYIAPAVRFTVKNTGDKSLTSVQATATYRRKGEENVTWGSDFRQVASREHALAAGQTMLVVLKSDARYYSPGPPESMFGHAQFKDTSVEFFLRVGASPWTKFGQADVERRIGTRSVTGGGAPSPGVP
jgi:hypothetical protein